MNDIDIFVESRKNQAEFERVVAEMKPSKSEYILIAGGKLLAIGEKLYVEEICYNTFNLGVYMLKRVDDIKPTYKQY